MSKESTIQLNNSEFIIDEWRQSRTSSTTDPQTLWTHQFKQGSDYSKRDLQLPWVQHQSVVCFPPTNFYTLVGKRLTDLVLAGLVTVFILSWMMPILGALILTESRGPFFFVQMRSGRRGKQFRCLKFRTMRDAPTQSIFQQTARDDVRITPLGKFLRKTNLDEMPQFLNVLVGDMSIVGPRPHAVPHDAQHWTSAAYRERYWVRPGITGLAQVRGARGATGHKQSMDHRVRYDHLYIPRQTFLLDMKLCLRTLKLMFRGDSNAW